MILLAKCASCILILSSPQYIQNVRVKELLNHTFCFLIWTWGFDIYTCLFLQAEEAKLITQLAEIDAINYGLFRQAYDASLDMSKILNKYEISKLLKGPYDMEGACLIIKAGGKGYSEVR